MAEKYTKKSLLENSKTYSILELYLIKYPKKEIRFSEFEDKLVPKIFKERPYLSRFLGYLIRERILIQKAKREPYYLKEKYYNFVAQKYNDKIIQSFPSSSMIPFISPYIYSTIFYGFNPDELDKNEMKEIGKSWVLLNEALENLNKIKEKQLEKCYKNVFNKLSKNLNDKDREYLSKEWDTIKSKFLIHVIYSDNPRDISKEEIKEWYQGIQYGIPNPRSDEVKKEEEFPFTIFYTERQIDLLSKAEYELIKTILKNHPFKFGITSFQSFSISLLLREIPIEDMIQLEIANDPNFIKSIDSRLKDLNNLENLYIKNNIPIPDDLQKEIDYYNELATKIKKPIDILYEKNRMKKRKIKLINQSYDSF